MKNLAKILKVLMINAIILSLIQIPFVNKSYAAEKEQAANKGFDASAINGITNLALRTYSSYLGQKQQILQQQISAANNQRLMSQLSPACRKADGKACFTTPAKYFPECTLPASMSNMPTNVCNAQPASSPAAQAAQMGSMLTYESIAQGWMNYYDQMSNEASNSSYAVGLRCLYDKEKALDSQLTEMVNSLQRLQDRMNQDKQIFRDNNKKLLADMDTANAELFGAGDSKNLALKTLDFAKYFSQSCQSVIGKENLSKGSSNGLNGILQGLSSTNKAASDFNLNKNVIEDDVRREVSKIAASISSKGVADFLLIGHNPEDVAGAKSISKQLLKEGQELQIAKERINKELKEVGYSAPVMDKNFSVDMDSFIADSNDFFRKKYVNDCVTGNNQGIAIPVSDILKSLEQKATKSAGTATNDYRAALQNIINSDAMIDDKMASIKELDNKYSGITITYKNESETRVTESPYDLFMKTIDKCQQRFAQSDQTSSKGSGSVSFQKKVERARTALQELKNLNDGFASKVTQSILSQVLDCNGSAPKAGSCSEQTLNSSDEKFCITHASTCAGQIQGCYAEANNQIQARKTKMENLAKTFNANVASMIARSNALFEQQKAAVTNITKLIQSKFPGTNFEIPKDMFVAMPEMGKDKYGVDMAGDGNLASFLDGEGSMPKKIEKLQEMFRKQKDTVKRAADEYIDLQKQAMARERGRWEDLNKTCKSAVDAASQAIAKANAEGAKRQGEEDANIAKFCKKYNSISENPIVACGKAKDLLEISEKVSRRISPGALDLTEKYESACDGFMNEKENSSGPDCYNDMTEGSPAQKQCFKERERNAAQAKNTNKAPNTLKTFRSLCGDSNGYKNNKEFIQAIAKKLSKHDQDILKDIDSMKALKTKVDQLENSDFIDQISSEIGEANACEYFKKNYYADEILKKEELEKLLKDKQSLIDTPEKKGKFEPNALKKFQDDIDRLEKDKIPNISLNTNFHSALADLEAISTPTSENEKINLVREIGNKMGEQSNGPCDMQNNSGIAKNMGFDLQGFDQMILGSGKTR